MTSMNSQACFIGADDLRIGLFVHIDVGWMFHPFPRSSFKIQSHAQIATIRSLGLKQIRYSPDKSDPLSVAEEAQAAVEAAPAVTIDPREVRRELRRKQDADLKACESRYQDTAKGYRELTGLLRSEPVRSLAQAQNLVEGVITQLKGCEEISIRLLSEQIGDRASQHSVNVLVLSLMLGKACGLAASDLQALGCGALLHDIGKQELPDRLKWFDEQFSSVEAKAHQEHVSHGVILGKSMNLPTAVLLCIAQHHEAINGTGYPMRLSGAQISPLAGILALINHYDCLCNPGNPAKAHTPHEALSTIFTRGKSLYDAKTLGVFIRLMGVYPPGSVVQLSDERYAIVASVNSARPLRPTLLIHDPGVPKEEALLVDLEQHPDLGIKRSVKPMQLPPQILNYLSPRQRVCYFFEQSVNFNGHETPQ